MPELRLKSFEVDESNEFALALLGAVVQLKKGYSPLLIHGEPGCGKTHLLSALTADLIIAHPETSLLYIPDDFPIEKLLLGGGNGPGNGSEEFIYKAYSRKDLLIIDDIERFGGDPKIRERFYSLFDAFVDNAKQVVLASSRPIEELQDFNDRFRSRLRGGIDARLFPPKPEGRLKILKRECNRLGLKLDVDVLQLLMMEAGTDIRYLKKLPSHIKTFAALNRQSPTREKVEEFLAIIRAEAGKDKASATAEQVYGSWVQSKARKREEKLIAKIKELEQQLSDQVQKTNELKEELEGMKSLQRSPAEESSDYAAQIQQLKLELEEKESRLRLQEKTISGEIAALNTQIEERDRLIENLKTESENALAEKDSRLSELEKELGRRLDDAAIGEDRQKEAEAVVNALRAEIEQLKKSGEDELLSLKIQLEDKDQNLKLLREEREMRAAEYEKERAELEEHGAELQNRALLLEGAIEDLNGRIGELEEQLELKSAELADAVELQNAGAEQHETLRKQLQEVRAKLQAESERHAADLKDRVGRERHLSSSLESVENELESFKKEAEKRNAEWQSRLDAVSEKLRQSEKAAAKAAESLSAENEKTKRLESELALLNSSLEEVKKAKDSEIAELRRTVSEKDEALAGASGLEARLRNEIDNLSGLLDGERSRAQSNERQADELSQRVAELEAALGSARAELEDAGGQQQAHMGQIEELTKERDSLREKIGSLDGEISELINRSEELEAVISGRDSKIKELDTALSDLRARLDERERELEEKEKEKAELVKGLEEQLKQREGDVQSLESQLDDRTSALDASKQEIEKLNGEVSRLSGELSALGEEKTRSEAGLSDAVKESAERLEAAEKQISDLRARLDEAEGQSAELMQQLETSLEQIKEEKEKSAGLEKSLSEAKASFEAELGEASKEIDGLRADIAQLEEQQKSLSAKGKDADENISRLEGELKLRNEELQKLSSELEERNREIESREKDAAKLSERLSSLDAKFKAASDQVDEHRSNAKALEKELKKHKRMLKGAQEEAARSAKLAKEKDRHIADLQRTIDSMRRDIAKRKARGMGAEQKFSPLEAELAEKEKALASLRLDFDELRKGNEELKNSAEKIGRQLAELESEKARKDREIASGQERINQLESRLAELERGDGGQSQQELRSRIEELENIIAEKDKAVESAGAMENEIARLKSEHEKIAVSLKEQVKEAMKELVRARESSEEQARKYREEAETLRASLAEVKSAEVQSTEPEEPPERRVAETVAEPDASAEDESGELVVPDEIDIPEKETEVAAEIRERSRELEWVDNFESFQVSAANAFSVSMAEKIARNPGELYNPLCIYGPTSSGKTHILHSIGDLSTSEDPGLICAMPSIVSLLEVVQAGPPIVGDWLRTVRLLIIDDFQIAGISAELQRELYRFLKTLVGKGAQVVIASEEPPIRMNYLQEYFLRFLEGGLLAKLEPNPNVAQKQQEAAEAFAAVARAMAVLSDVREKAAAVDEEEEKEKETPDAEAASPDADAEPPRDFLDEFLSADPSLATFSFRGKNLFDEFEEAFKYPNKKWKNKFPLLVIEDDEHRRKRFFNALANRLGDIFSSPVSLLSVEELAEMLALTPAFDWNGLLNKLVKSSVVLVNDCDSVIRLPDSAAGYLQAIMEELTKRDTLLMIGISKRYKKEPVFGSVYRKASRKKI